MGKAREKISNIIKKSEVIEMEVKKKMVGYITAGFGVVAGLAWNDAIKAFIEEYFPQHSSNVVAKFVYAFIITVLVVIVSLYLVKLLKTKEKEETKNPAE